MPIIANANFNKLQVSHIKEMPHTLETVLGAPSMYDAQEFILWPNKSYDGVDVSTPNLGKISEEDINKNLDNVDRAVYSKCVGIQTDNFSEKPSYLPNATGFYFPLSDNLYGYNIKDFYKDQDFDASKTFSPGHPAKVNEIDITENPDTETTSSKTFFSPKGATVSNQTAAYHKCIEFHNTKENDVIIKYAWEEFAKFWSGDNLEIQGLSFNYSFDPAGIKIKVNNKESNLSKCVLTLPIESLSIEENSLPFLSIHIKSQNKGSIILKGIYGDSLTKIFTIKREDSSLMKEDSVEINDAWTRISGYIFPKDGQEEKDLKEIVLECTSPSPQNTFYISGLDLYSISNLENSLNRIFDGRRIQAISQKKYFPLLFNLKHSTIRESINLENDNWLLCYKIFRDTFNLGRINLLGKDYTFTTTLKDCLLGNTWGFTNDKFILNDSEISIDSIDDYENQWNYIFLEKIGNNLSIQLFSEKGSSNKYTSISITSTFNPINSIPDYENPETHEKNEYNFELSQNPGITCAYYKDLLFCKIKDEQEGQNLIQKLSSDFISITKKNPDIEESIFDLGYDWNNEGPTTKLNLRASMFEENDNGYMTREARGV